MILSRRSFNGHTRRAAGTEREPGDTLDVGRTKGETRGWGGTEEEKWRRSGGYEEVMWRVLKFGESCLRASRSKGRSVSLGRTSFTPLCLKGVVHPKFTLFLLNTMLMEVMEEENASHESAVKFVSKQ